MDGSALYAVAAALLGLILGSFLNALLYRFNTGRSALRGRSCCMHCGHTLAWYDLIPLVSFVLLRGRCRYCRCRLSLQYPLVEAAAAALSLALYLKYPATPLLYAAGLGAWLTLLFIFVYDLRHCIIPWSASGLLAFFALLHIALAGPTLEALIAGPVLAAPLFFFSLVSRGRWMGWGDGALQLGLGWLLGLSAGFSGLMIAFWSGAVVGIALSLYSQWPSSARTPRRARYTMKSEVPFAPFLILGAGCAYFLHVDFFATLPALFL